MNKQFPYTFISPDFHNKSDKSWYLLKMTMKINNQKKIFPNLIVIFREIGYTDNERKLIGIGRSYMPLNLLSLGIILRCICLFKPKPLGLVLKERFGDRLKIVVESTENKKMFLYPYWLKEEVVTTYKRVIQLDRKNIAAVEEVFKTNRYE